MSGIEVAGLVLGALPIAIELLKALQPTYGIRIECQIKRLIRRIRSVRTTYVSELDRLLSKACDNYGELCGSVERPDMDEVDSMRHVLMQLLRQPKVQKQVKDYTRYRFGVISENIYEFTTILREALQIFRKALSPSMQQAIDAYSDRDYHAFLRKMNEGQDLIQKNYLSRLRDKHRLRKAKPELEEVISDLERLEDELSKHARHEPTVAIALTQSSQTDLEYFEDMHRAASQLYGAMHRDFRGTCHRSHTVHLFLQSPQHQRSHARRYNLSHGIALLYTDVDDERKILHEGTIRLESAYLDATTVDNVCRCFQNQTQSKLELTLSDNGRLLSSLAPVAGAAKWRPLASSMVDLPLATILKEPSCLNLSTRRKLLPTSRYRIALRIASSLLQLDCTQWRLRFHAGDICFRAFKKGAQYEIENAESPFISREDLQAVAELTVPLSLPNLAILLLEVHHLKSFESWLSQENTDENDSVQKPNTADNETPIQLLDRIQEWVDTDNQNMDDAYYNAIKFCIGESYQGSRRHDEMFRIRYINNVILPLQGICRAADEYDSKF